MPKGVVIVIVTGVIAVIGGVLLVQELRSPDSGEEVEIDGPDSGEEEYNPREDPDSGEEVDTSGEPTSPDSGEEVTLSEYFKEKAKGSCNAISAGSTCIEYIGSLWTSGYAQMNCTGGGTYVNGPCPRPSIGGCRFGADTPNEIVTWHYDYGGDPITLELKPYTSGACTALPMGQWVE